MEFQIPHDMFRSIYELQPGDVKPIAVEEIQMYKKVIEAVYGSSLCPDRDKFHQADHIARTLVLGKLLIHLYKQQGKRVDERVVLLGVILHDYCFSDDEQVDHGQMGADELAALLSDAVPPKIAKHVITIVAWHNKRRRDVPMEARSNEFDIVTTADALELNRLDDGRAIEICTIEGMKLRRVARVLQRRYDKEDGHNAFDRVLRAGVKMGILVAP